MCTLFALRRTSSSSLLILQYDTQKNQLQPLANLLVLPVHLGLTQIMPSQICNSPACLQCHSELVSKTCLHKGRAAKQSPIATFSLLLSNVGPCHVHCCTHKGLASLLGRQNFNDHDVSPGAPLGGQFTRQKECNKCKGRLYWMQQL